MAIVNNKIEISVEVSGIEQGNKKIDSLKENTIDLKEGISGVGENFKAVSSIVAKDSERMGAGIGLVGESVVGVIESLNAFKEVSKTAGMGAGASITGLLGPLSLLVGAISLAYEAWREFSGAAREAEMWSEVMSATASDLTSRMEALAETGIKLTSNELRSFISTNQQARIALEMLNSKNEDLLKTYKENSIALKELESAQKAMNAVDNKAIQLGDAKSKTFMEQVASLPELISLLWDLDEATEAQSDSTTRLEKARSALADAEKKLGDEYEKALPLIEASLRIQNALSKDQLGLMDDLRASIYAKADAEIEGLEAQGKTNEALQVYKTATEQANLETKKRIEYQDNLNKRVKEGYITQEQANEALKNLKFETYDLTQGYNKQTEAVRRSNEVRVRERESLEKIRARNDEFFNQSMQLLREENKLKEELYKKDALMREDLLSGKGQELKQQRERVIVELNDLILLYSGYEDFYKKVWRLRDENLLKGDLNIETLNLESEKVKAIIGDIETFRQQIPLYTRSGELEKLDLFEQLNKQVNLLKENELAVLNNRYAEEQANAQAIKSTKLRNATLKRLEIEHQNNTQEIRNKGFFEMMDQIDAIKKKELDSFSFSRDLAIKEENLNKLNLETRRKQEDNLAAFNHDQVVRSILSEREKSSEIKKLALDRLDDELNNAIIVKTLDKEKLEQKRRYYEELANLAKISKDEETLQTYEQLKADTELNIQFLESSFELYQENFKNTAIILAKEKRVLDETTKAQMDSLKGFYTEQGSGILSILDKVRTSFIGTGELFAQSMKKQRMDDLAETIKDVEKNLKSLNQEYAQTQNRIEEHKTKVSLQKEAYKALQEAVSEASLSYSSYVQILKHAGNTEEQILLSPIRKKLENELIESQKRVKQFSSQGLDLDPKVIQESGSKLVGLRMDILNEQKKLTSLVRDQNRIIAEDTAATWESIGMSIKDSFSGATQSLMSEISALIYDDSIDQKRKDLDKQRAKDLKSFKGTMEERMAIDQAYAEQKKALDEEESNRLPNVLKATLRNLAIEATGRALFEGAAALASLAIYDMKAAAFHGQAAAAYGLVAATTGTATLLAGGPVSSSSSASSSPSGLSQTGSTTPTREQAQKTEPVVFNISFAGANVYDSRTAAMRAFSNEIMSYMTQTTRGSYSIQSSR